MFLSAIAACAENGMAHRLCPWIAAVMLRSVVRNISPVITPQSGATAVSAAGETPESRLSMQIYTDSKPAYYNFAEKTPMLTEQDIMAMFQAE